MGGEENLISSKRSFPKIDIIAYTKPTRENRSENNRERILSGGGLSPAISATEYKEPMKVALPSGTLIRPVEE